MSILRPGCCDGSQFHLGWKRAQVLPKAPRPVWSSFCSSLNTCPPRSNHSALPADPRPCHPWPPLGTGTGAPSAPISTWLILSPPAAQISFQYESYLVLQPDLPCHPPNTLALALPFPFPVTLVTFLHLLCDVLLYYANCSLSPLIRMWAPGRKKCLCSQMNLQCLEPRRTP